MSARTNPFDGPAFASGARAAVADAEPWRDVANLSDAELVELVRRRMSMAAVWDAAEYGGVHEAGYAADGPMEEAEDLIEKHDVAFAVVDANGDAYGGLDYVLEGPGGEREAGTLAASGQLDKKDVTSEAYTFTLRAVGEVAWCAGEAKAGVEVGLDATLTGFDDGAELEVRLFRQYAELDDDVLATLTATVEAGRVHAVWTYEHDPNGPLAKDQGMVDIVAEVRDGEDGPWAKTREPLRLQLPTLDAARWATDHVEPAQELALSLTAAGVPDGTPIDVEIYQARRSGEELLLESFADLTVENEAVTLTWQFPPAEDTDAPVDAECFFVATLDGDPNRVVVSDNLSVGIVEQESDEDDAAEE